MAENKFECPVVVTLSIVGSLKKWSGVSVEIPEGQEELCAQDRLRSFVSLKKKEGTDAEPRPKHSCLRNLFEEDKIYSPHDLRRAVFYRGLSQTGSKDVKCPFVGFCRY